MHMNVIMTSQQQHFSARYLKLLAKQGEEKNTWINDWNRAETAKCAKMICSGGIRLENIETEHRMVCCKGHINVFTDENNDLALIPLWLCDDN